MAVVRPFNNVTAIAAGVAHALAPAEWATVNLTAIGANVTLTPAASGAYEGQVCGAIVSAGNGVNSLALAGIVLPLGALVYTGESALLVWTGSAWVLVDVVYDYASRSTGGGWSFTVANAAARLALPVAAADVGKTCRQTDIARTFTLLDNSPMVWGEEETDDIVGGWRRNVGGPSTTFNVLGANGSITGGSAQAATINNTSPATRLIRVLDQTSAAINSPLLFASNQANPIPAGGIRLMWEFTVEVIGSPQRWGIGFGAASLVASSDVVNNVSCVFIGRGNDEANVQLYHNDAAGTCTQTDLGASFPAGTSATRYLLELYTFDGSTWAMNLLNVATRAEVSATMSSNLPAAGTAQVWQMFGNTVSNAAALSLGHSELKLAQLNRYA